MGLQACGLNLDSAKKELMPHGSLEFPCGGYDERLADSTKDDVPWHWHEELEILYAAAGTLRVQVPAMTFDLVQGDCVAINAGVLHSASAPGEGTLHSLVFSPLLLTGTQDSVFARKYLAPLTNCRAFRACRLDRAGTDAFTAAFDALARETPGYEFRVRERLSALCYALFERFSDSIAHGAAPLDQDDLRIQKMLEHIQRAYAGTVTLADIAAAGGVGERECLRCFARTIGLSPIQYLLKYRVMRGAEALVRAPAASISEVAAACGFESPGNFARLFRRFYNCSPRAYRAANTAAS